MTRFPPRNSTVVVTRRKYLRSQHHQDLRSHQKYGRDDGLGIIHVCRVSSVQEAL